MVNFTVDEIRDLMDVPLYIRNISVIAHVDHGKSTLTDSLIGHAGIIAQARAGDTRFMDTRADEQDRTITIKSTGVSLHFAIDKTRVFCDLIEGGKELVDNAIKEKVQKMLEDAKDDEAKAEVKKQFKKMKKNRHFYPDEGKQSFLINLIDSPGHVDFSSEVTAALRVTDGALVVVDCVEGVCVQTETVLRQAIAERIRPILWVNKLDRVFLELHMDLDEAYQSFSRAVESVNVVIATYKDDLLGDVQVYPSEGTVGFGSGLQGWGFTVTNFAETYAGKFGVSKKLLMKKLWGDNFMRKGKWTNKQYDKKGNKIERGFCQFILTPIQSMHDAVMDEKKDVFMPMLESLNIEIPKDAKDFVGKPLLKRIMQTWLPAAEALLEMIVNFLPSPVVAQAYRVENLYSGPLDDEAAQAIKACDPNGPLMMYVSKMVPTSEKGRFYAFGRVYSGTIATGQTVRIQGPDYKPGSKTDLYIKKIQRTVLMMGRYVEQMPDCPCGNTIGLVGVDAYLLKSGTLTTFEGAHNFVDMKYSVSPVVRVSVECKNASDLPKLMEGLKRLAKSDPLVKCYTAPTGEHIIAGAGELHLEICLKDLREEYMKGAPVHVADPVVSFSETVTGETEHTCVSKSPNKHNKIYMTAEPLGDELTKAIEEKEVHAQQDAKSRAQILTKEYKWDVQEARKIWSFGILDGLCNLLVDSTKGVQFMNEIKDSMVGAFQQNTMAGVIAEECMRGIRFSIEDVNMHADAIHRGAGQIMPPAKRVMFACQMKSEPRLLEPMYLCDITVPNHAIAGVYSTLNARRGVIEGKEDRPGTPLCKVTAFLPVLESFGFTSLLRQNTGGQAFPQLIFHHWQLVNGNPLDEGTQAYDITMAVRQRKGIKVELPKFTDYYDRL